MTRRRRTSHRLRWALGLVGVVAVLLLGFTGYQAFKAKGALEATATDFETLRTQLSGGERAEARQTLADAQEHARTAVSNTHGPLWWLSAQLPELGPNVQAVQVVAAVADDLATDTLPDVLAAADTLRPENLQPRKGRVDLGPLRAVEQPVSRTSVALSAQSGKLGTLDPDVLWSSIAAPVTELQTKVRDASALAGRASIAVRLLPGMLGGDGPRRYLFLFQNNAEIRATGGIPGAFALMKADDGKLTLGQQSDSSGLGSFEQPPVKLTKQELELWGEAMGTFPQDVNFTPDFPRSAELATAMWTQRYGGRLDGVISVDPVALSYLLQGTGPVPTVGGRTLSADNVVDLLLSKVYAQVADPAQQNVFFDAAARSVFDAVSSGAGNPRAVVDGLARAAAEHRLLVWSAHKDEQELLQPTALGAALGAAPATVPEVGVYLNAALPYKLDYYLEHDVTVESTSCQEGRQRMVVTLTMRSRAPQDPAGLSTYVAPEVPMFGRGTLLDTVYFVAPDGGYVQSTTVDGEDRDFTEAELDGHPVALTTLHLKPGERRTATVEIVGGRGQTDDPQLRVTPGARTSGIGEVGASSCS